MDSLFGKKDMLPTHGAKRNNGVSLPTTNINVVLSLVWLVASLLIIYCSYLHCSNNSIRNELKCMDTQCTLTFRPASPSGDLSFLKQNLVDVEMVRVSGDKVVETNDMKRREMQKLGYSVQITYKTPAAEGSRLKVQKSVLLMTSNMGRRESRSVFNKILAFIDGKSTELNVSVGKWWTAYGIFGIIAGIFSAIMSLAFGQWSDPAPKRMRKAK